MEDIVSYLYFDGLVEENIDLYQYLTQPMTSRASSQESFATRTIQYN